MGGFHEAYVSSKCLHRSLRLVSNLEESPQASSPQEKWASLFLWTFPCSISEISVLGKEARAVGFYCSQSTTLKKSFSSSLKDVSKSEISPAMINSVSSSYMTRRGARDIVTVFSASIDSTNFLQNSNEFFKRLLMFLGHARQLYVRYF